MKNLKSLLMLCALIILSSCSSENDFPVNPFASGDVVTFNATIGNGISTRVKGTTWEKNDAIGVYALTPGKGLADGIHEGMANKKQITDGTSTFTPADENAKIKFPSQGGALDFIAYYPYTENISNNQIAVNVEAQSSSSDVLYSNNAKGAKKDDGVVNMHFTHKLAMLVLNIASADGSALTGLTATIDGLKVDGTMNLENGVITLGNTSKQLTPAAEVNGDKATIKAILVPGQNLNSAKITFIVNGKTYVWTPSAQDLNSGLKYTYTLNLVAKAGTVEEVHPNATIGDWSEGYTGATPIDLNPEQGAQFITDKTSVEIAAKGNLTSVIKLITTDTQAWTAASDAAWLTIDAATGTGSKDLTLTAQENTANAARTAKVTLKAEGFDDVVITVNQAAGESTPVPTANLLAPWSDFENWSLFTNSLNSFGLSTNGGYVSQNSTAGIDGSSALALKGTPTKNDYVFTALVKDGVNLTGKSKIILWVKGTSAKSLSINVYVGTGNSMGTDYKCFNVGDMTNDVTIDASDSNAYTGNINTNGEWKKITLNIAGLKINSGLDQNLFALKVGGTSAYDLLIDNITVE